MTWLPKKKVVVPVDSTDFSLTALDVALQLVESAAGIHIVHVLPPIPAMEPGIGWVEVDESLRHREAEAALRQRIDAPCCRAATIVVRTGNPFQEIADYAGGIDADLIVMHSHGRTGAAQLLVGSVSERVVRHAHCPVLVLRE